MKSLNGGDFWGKKREKSLLVASVHDLLAKGTFPLRLNAALCHVFFLSDFFLFEINSSVV